MGIRTRNHAGHASPALPTPATRASSRSPSATPSASPRPARSPRSAPAEAATTTPWPKRSTLSSRPSWPGIRASGVHRRPRDRRRGGHRLFQPQASARRDQPRSTRQARGRPLPSRPRPDHRRGVNSEPRLNAGRARTPLSAKPSDLPLEDCLRFRRCSGLSRQTERLGDEAHGLLELEVLPDTDDCPPGSAESLVCGTVSDGRSSQLRAPVGLIRSWCSAVNRA